MNILTATQHDIMKSYQHLGLFQKLLHFKPTDWFVVHHTKSTTNKLVSLYHFYSVFYS